MDIESAFKNFYNNILLTSNQRKDAKRKYDGVCSKLHSFFYPDTSYDGQTRFLIGSYGKGTHIRPARDIDVIFVMPPDKFVQYDDNNSNCQSQLLQDVKKILQEKYPNTPMKAFGKVVVLEFSDPRHNVELVPGWENSDGTFTIPNSENGGSWEIVNPRKDIKIINDSETQTGKTKAIIRMIKKWTETCTASIKSHKIEKAVIEYFQNHETPTLTSGLVRDFFSYLHHLTSDEILKSHLNTALNRALKACDFEEDGKLDKASDEWRKIFGITFPTISKKEMSQNLQAIIANLQSAFPSATEEYIDITYGVPIVLDPSYSVKLSVNINQNGWRHNYWLLSEFQKHGYRIQKSAALIFKIASHNVPGPYEVKWKVRNFGVEARDVGQLRGEITNDDGTETKKESTMYHGEHYVECYIVKNGQCVAMDSVFVPIK